MAFLIGGANSASAAGGFSVANSVRFNDGDSPQLHRDQPGAPTSTTIFTWSGWFKLGSSTSQITLASSFTSGSVYDQIKIMATATHNNVLRIEAGSNEGNAIDLKATQRLRDPTAWYHLVLAVDTTQGTAANRDKVYLNGTQITDWQTETHSTQNDTWHMNTNGKTIKVGVYDNGTPQDFFDGYLAEVVQIDGQQLAPTSFGEFDEDSPTIWKPIDVSGLTFGNNGYYMDFEDSSALGNDVAGKGDFTVANLAAADQATDTCTNNFCTMNPLDNFYKAAAFSEGNCRTVGGASSKNNWITSTFALSKGKWYCEMVVPDVTTDHTNVSWGISDIVSIDATSALGDEPGSAQCGFRMSNGHKRLNDASTSYGNSYSVGQVIGMTVNLDDSEVKYFINNTVQNSGTAIDITAVSSTRNGYYFIACGDESDVDGTLAFNFGGCSGFAVSSAQADENGYGAFEYAPPSGFYAICTKNLAEYG